MSQEKHESQFYAEDLVRFGTADWSIVRRLLVYLRPYLWQAIVAAFLLLLSTFLIVLIPNILRLFVDEVLTPNVQRLARGEALPSDAAAGLYHYAWMILGCVSGYAFSSASQGYLFAWLGQRVMFDIRRDLFAHVQRLPVRYYDKNPVGRLVTRVTNDIASLNELFAGGFVQLVNDIFMIAGIVGAMFYLEWPLAAWATLPLPPLFVAVAYIARKSRVILREAKRLIARINAFLNENITGMNVIQLFSREGERDRAFRKVVDVYTDTQYSLVSVQSFFLPISTFFSGLMMAAIMWVGGHRALAGITTIGTLTAFLYYAQQLYFPIRTFTDKFNILLLAMASAERIFTLMDEPMEFPEGEKSLGVCPENVAHPSAGEIAFENVSFGYTSEMQALRDVSFRIAAGENVAVVGATGSGKTTLVNLLVRFYENFEGNISLDGRLIQEISKQEIRCRVGVVPQDVFLFSGSLLGNLFLPGDLSEEECRARATKIFEELGCLEFLERLPKGLDTVISERGGNLSAGERQLVAFARLLCYDPEVVVLDEATANIDASTERLLQKATARLTRGRTSIIIAHRLSTILGMDRILVLHHARLVEEGTHQELLEKGGTYAKLYELQFAGGAPAPQEAVGV